jgi:putative DNA primase/helicase
MAAKKPLGHEGVARDFVKKLGRKNLRYYQGQFFQFNGKTFDLIPDEDFQATITTFTKSKAGAPKTTLGFISNVRNSIAAKTIVSSNIHTPAWLGAGEKHFLSFSNGLVSRDALIAGGEIKVEPHNPDWFSQTSLPYAYDPEAKAEQWVKFLEEVLPDPESRVLLQEFFGYALTSDTSQQKFLLLEGQGSNGKSVIVKVLVGLLGEQNTSAVPLESFGDRFALAATVGKLINVSSEASKVSPRIEGIIKQFVAGDLLTIDRKHIAQLQFRPSARIVVTTNKRPNFDDTSNGIWRRMLVVSFNVQIPEAKQIANLDELLLKEASGILNWSITGLRRLKARGSFTRPRVMEDTIQLYRAEDSPVLRFIQDHVEEAPREFILSERLYLAYTQWSHLEGEKPLSNVQFAKALKRRFPTVERRQVRERQSPEFSKWGYEGVKVTFSPMTVQ